MALSAYGNACAWFFLVLEVAAVCVVEACHGHLHLNLVVHDEVVVQPPQLVQGSEASTADAVGLHVRGLHLDTGKATRWPFAPLVCCKV